MTKTAFNRNNVLTEDERVDSGRKCYNLLELHTGDFNQWELEFINNMGVNLDRGRCSERQLAKLRDLVEKYAQ